MSTHMNVQTTICGRRPNVSETGASTRGPIPSMARYVNEDVWKTEVVTSGWSLRKPALAAPFACRPSFGQHRTPPSHAVETSRRTVALNAEA